MRKPVFIFTSIFTPIFILTCLISLVVLAMPAHAVIPQLLGPLSALLGLIPQILAFVGVALITALVFARDTVKLFFYRLRDFAVAHKVLTSVLSLILVSGLAWGTYQLVTMSLQSASTTRLPAPQRGASTSAQAMHPWLTFRGGAERTGHADELPGPTAGNFAWICKAPGSVAVDFSSSPAVVGNRLYIGATQGSIFSVSGATYCIDADTGEVLWRHDSEIPIFSSPAVAGGRVYIGEGFHQDSGCHLSCLDAKSGEPIWRFQTASHVESTPFISQGKLYFTAGADGVYCIDALEGQQIWHYPDVHADMSPVVHNGKVYFGTGYGDYRVYAVDAQTGEEIWTQPMAYPVWGSPSIQENLVFFGMGTGNFSESAPLPRGKVAALNTETGEKVWQYETEDAVLTAIVSRNGRVTFGSRDEHVYTLSATDGELLWKTFLASPVVSSPAVTKDTVYVGSTHGRVYALSADTGEVQWEFDVRYFDGVGHGIELYSSPAVANGRLYIGSSSRYVFCLGGGSPTQIPADR